MHPVAAITAATCLSSSHEKSQDSTAGCLRKFAYKQRRGWPWGTGDSEFVSRRPLPDYDSDVMVGIRPPIAVVSCLSHVCLKCVVCFGPHRHNSINARIIVTNSRAPVQ